MSSQLLDNQQVITATLSVFAVVAVGFFCRFKSLLTSESISAGMKVLVNVMMPCFIWQKLAGKSTGDSSNLILLPLLGIGLVVSSLLFMRLFTLIAGNKLGLDSHEKIKTFTYSTALQNYGFLPIPLVIMLYGEQLLPLLLLHNVVIEIFVWTVGVSYLSGSIGWKMLKKVFSPPAISAILALIVNSLELSIEAIPAVVSNPISIIAQASVPTALILIGGTIFEELSKLRDWRQAWPNYLKICTISSVFRLGILPFVMLSLLSLFEFPDDVKKILLLQAAMPAAIMPVVMTRLYGGHPLTAIKIAVVTSFLGLISISFWISYGQTILFGK